VMDAGAARVRAAAIVHELVRDVTVWDPRVLWPAILTFGTAAILIAAAGGRLGPRAPGRILPLLTVLDLMAFGLGYNPRTPRGDITERPATTIPPLGVPGGYRAAILGRRVPERVDATLLSASLGLLWGIEDVAVPSSRSPDVERWNELDGLGLSSVPDPAGRWWQNRVLSRISGVRWIYSLEALDLPVVARDTVGTTEVRVYEDRTALPRAFIVGCAVPGGADPIVTTARIEEPTAIAVADVAMACAPGPAGSVTPLRAPLGVIHAFDADFAREGLLVVTEARYPGQRWTVDGTVRDAVPADGIFQGMVLPAGRHHVEIAYAPWWLLASVLLSGAASLAATGTMAWSWRRP
jgi:hypothetical protein